MFNARLGTRIAVRAAVIIACAGLVGSTAADITFTTEGRYLWYQIEVGQDPTTETYEDTQWAGDFVAFDDSLYLNAIWPAPYDDVEGRASVDQVSSVSDTQITAVGTSHVHAFVQEDQTRAFAEAMAESHFEIGFTLSAPAAAVLSGETNHVRSPSDPPREVTTSIVLSDANGSVYEYGEEGAFAFSTMLDAGDYTLTIVAYTEAYSAGPWRQYAEGTAEYDVTLTLTCPADLNGDAAVDLTDLGTLLGNFGAAGATREDGDLSGDGTVDLTDLGMLLAAFGGDCP